MSEEKQPMKVNRRRTRPYQSLPEEEVSGDAEAAKADDKTPAKAAPRSRAKSAPKSTSKRAASKPADQSEAAETTSTTTKKPAAKKTTRRRTTAPKKAQRQDKNEPAPKPPSPETQEAARTLPQPTPGAVDGREVVLRNHDRAKRSFRHNMATRVVRRHAAIAAGVGILPFPVLDAAAITALQLHMLKQIADEYDQPFHDTRGKAIIAALVGGATTATVGLGVLRGMMRAIPVVGPAVGFLATPTYACATTWALGNVFIQHHESGGSLLTFEPELMRAHYEAELVKAGG